MFCNQCGRQLSKKSKFCPECGTEIRKRENTCYICDGKIGLLSFKLNNNEYICYDCLKKIDRDKEFNTKTLKNSSRDEILKRIEYVKEQHRIKEQEIIKSKIKKGIDPYFYPTVRYGQLWFNDKQQIVAIAKSPTNSDIYERYKIKYDDIISYEILEEEHDSTSGGLIGANVGRFIFGGISKDTDKICTKLEIKLTTKTNVYFIEYINRECNKDLTKYKKAFRTTQEAIAKLQRITNEIEAKKAKKNIQEQNAASSQGNQNNLSVADEIKKFKELLDDDVITLEEFNKQKNKLLN